MAGNPHHDQPHILKTNPFNYNNYLYFSGAPLKFYKSTSTDFTFHAPRCQDSFRLSFLSLHLPEYHLDSLPYYRQSTGNTYKYYPTCTFFSMPLKRQQLTLSPQCLKSRILPEQVLIKELSIMLSGLQLQFRCLSSIEKALENVTDNSIAAACNLQLARRDSVLKVLAPNLNEYDFNCLALSAMTSVLPPSTSLRTDNKGSYHYKRNADDRAANKQQSRFSQWNFHEQGTSSKTSVSSKQKKSFKLFHSSAS